MSKTPLKCENGDDHDFSKEVPLYHEGEVVGTSLVCAKCEMAFETFYEEQLKQGPLRIILVKGPESTAYWRCRDGACPTCREREGFNYELDVTEELPPNGCNCEGGCRSYYENVPYPVIWWQGIDVKGVMVCQGGKEHVFSETVEDAPQHAYVEDSYKCAGCGRLMTDVISQVDSLVG
jgi:hypothetical protein